MLVYLAFFSVVIGSKLLLALVTIYLLFPTDDRCPACDGQTLLLRSAGTRKAAGLLFLGRVTWRWCPRCRWEGGARGRPAPRIRVGPPPSRSVTRS